MKREPDRVLEYLFIGGSREVNEKYLLSLKIKYILNVLGGSYDSNSPFEKIIVPLSDYGSTELNEVLPTCIKFIKDVKENNGKVVVHCQGGVNRSATVVLAYLVLEESMTLKQSWELLKQSRPRVSPHEKYWEQLFTLEKNKTGIVSITWDDIGPTIQSIMRNIREKYNNKLNEKDDETDTI